MNPDLHDRAKAAHAERTRGRAVPTGEILAALRAEGSPLAAAWTWALKAQGVLSGESSDPVGLGALSGIAEAEPAASAVVSLALTHVQRAALLSFDLSSLREAQALQQRVAERSAPSPSLSLRSSLGRTWLSWLAGDAVDVDLDATGREARECQLPELVVEAQVLAALNYLENARFEDATSAARRASRMARSEELPDSEVLASVVLARVRRFQNQPHLSLRILAGLVPHAPPIWRAWILWEAVLAGALSVTATHESSLAAQLSQMAQAARQGSAEDVQRSAQALLTRTQDLSPLFREANTAAALLAPELAEVPAVEVWRSGQIAELPPGIAGFAFASSKDPLLDSACARVVVSPGERAYRIVALATPLAVAKTGADLETASGPTRPRTDTGLATLALADTALDPAAYFGEVYEYPYESVAHRAMLNMHVQRMRERLGTAGDISREGGDVKLVPSRPHILRDPRCEEPLAQRTLRILAVMGRKSAGDLARELDAPLRTIQRILKDLHADAGVVQIKEGRAVSYQIEDTTFSEPTRSRRFETNVFSIEV